MAKAVLDASAVIAYLRQEPGANIVEDYLGDGIVSAVNLVEIISKGLDRGGSLAGILQDFASLGLEVIAFDHAQAAKAGVLREITKSAGLSLADRACLALAEHTGLPAITADKQWATLDLAIRVQIIR